MGKFAFMSAFFGLCRIWAFACCYYPEGPVINWRDPDSFFRENYMRADERRLAVATAAAEIPADARMEVARYLDAELSKPAGDDPDGYSAFREALGKAKKENGAAGPGSADGLLGMIPPGLSAELENYECGAVFYAAGDWENALAAFRSVLALEETRRRAKTLDAAYMAARCLHRAGRFAEALDAYAEVRRLYDAGFRSSQNLAFETFGFEAQARMQSGAYAESVREYLAIYAASGIDLGVAHAVGLILAGDGGTEALAGDDLCSRVASAYFASFNPGMWWTGGGKDRADALGRWAAALERGGRTLGRFGGGLAMAAYESGDLALAKRCLAAADPDEPLARWVGAKILLSEGEYAGAADILSALLKSGAFSGSRPGPDVMWGRPYGESPHEALLYASDYESPNSVAGGMYGVLKFDGGDLEGAADCFLQAQRYVDAAFVMEIAMDIEALKRYADGLGADMSPGADFVRSVLVLRMIAEGDVGGVKKYYAANPALKGYVEFMDSFCGAMLAGRDKSLPRRRRAVSLWRAFALYKGVRASMFAEVHRPLSYEGEADGFVELPYKNYMLSGLSFRWDEGDAKLLAARNPGNLAIMRSAPRFSASKYYRYRFFEIGFEAAELLGDGSPEQAKMYIAAAGEIMHRNPKRADKAYKALVRNCGGTELGRRADAMRWFPAIRESAADILAELEGGAAGGPEAKNRL